MEAEQREEWDALEQQAMQQVRDGIAPRRPGVRQIFQVLVLPSFEPAFSWEICQDTKVENRYFAVHRIWNKRADLSKLESPVARLRHPRSLEPTIEVRQSPLEAVWVEATRLRLKTLFIPAIVESEVIGLDGTYYEVIFNAGFVQARYHWWEEPPPGWRPLNQWLHQVLDDLEQLMESGENV